MTRKRNHRSKNNGTCQKISIAYYISTLDIPLNEKINYARNCANYAGEDTFYSDLRIIMFFSDGSLLSFNGRECNVVDSYARYNNGKKPTKSKRTATFV